MLRISIIPILAYQRAAEFSGRIYTKFDLTPGTKLIELNNFEMPEDKGRS